MAQEYCSALRHLLDQKIEELHIGRDAYFEDKEDDCDDINDGSSIADSDANSDNSADMNEDEIAEDDTLMMLMMKQIVLVMI